MVNHKFSDEELEIIFQAAEQNLFDIDMFERLAEHLDVTDDVLINVRNKLKDYFKEQES